MRIKFTCQNVATKIVRRCLEELTVNQDLQTESVGNVV